MSSIGGYGIFRITPVVLLAFQLGYHVAYGIQCYSCKGSGPNEVEANIRCLENAYLENCDDFYQYYSEVENSKVLSYEYYYYDDDGKEGSEEYEDEYYEEEGEEGEEEEKKEVDTSDETFRYSPTRTESEESDDYYDDEYDYDYDSRKKRDLSASSSTSDGMTSIVGDIMREARRKKRSTRTTKKTKKEKLKKEDEELEEDIEYEYEYEEVEEDYEDEEPASNTTIAARTTTPSTTADSDNDKPKPTMPKDPEHYCYSETKKNNWESYTVEKGCKKIMYCKSNLENLPQWSKPWNFCCDRARCNAKLVKDKPQRIFGMGCRRTDDCIQGYSSRPVCPNYFQSCPRISTSLIKMECRVKSRTMASVKSAARFQHMFSEKKCYCAKGYFPRGPICTSGSPPVQLSGLSLALLAQSLLLLMLH